MQKKIITLIVVVVIIIAGIVLYERYQNKGSMTSDQPTASTRIKDIQTDLNTDVPNPDYTTIDGQIKTL